jgi:hypothetical protein
MMISNEDLVASKPLYQILIDCDPDAPYLYAPFKVLNTCRLRGQSTKGVKTDIKRQTFRVANLPSAWTSNLEDIAVEEEEEIPIPDGSRMPGPHTTGVRLVAPSLDSDATAPTLGVNISTVTVSSSGSSAPGPLLSCPPLRPNSVLKIVPSSFSEPFLCQPQSR